MKDDMACNFLAEALQQLKADLQRSIKEAICPCLIVTRDNGDKPQNFLSDKGSSSMSWRNCFGHCCLSNFDWISFASVDSISANAIAKAPPEVKTETLEETVLQPKSSVHVCGFLHTESLADAEFLMTFARIGANGEYLWQKGKPSEKEREAFDCVLFLASSFLKVWSPNIVENQMKSEKKSKERKERAAQEPQLDSPRSISLLRLTKKLWWQRTKTCWSYLEFQMDKFLGVCGVFFGQGYVQIKIRRVKAAGRCSKIEKIDLADGPLRGVSYEFATSPTYLVTLRVDRACCSQDSQKQGLILSGGHRPMDRSARIVLLCFASLLHIQLQGVGHGNETLHLWRPEDVDLPTSYQQVVGLLSPSELEGWRPWSDSVLLCKHHASLRYGCDNKDRRYLLSVYGNIFDVSDREPLRLIWWVNAREKTAFKVQTSMTQLVPMQAWLERTLYLHIIFKWWSFCKSLQDLTWGLFAGVDTVEYTNKQKPEIENESADQFQLLAKVVRSFLLTSIPQSSHLIVFVVVCKSKLGWAHKDCQVLRPLQGTRHGKGRNHLRFIF